MKSGWSQVETEFSDKTGMIVSYTLYILSFLFFCGCCYALMKTITAPVPLMNRSEYSKSALRIARGYKTFAWACLTVFFMMTLVTSFYSVFIDL